jgi:nucleotide-binding universal stress UspA family protein
MAAPAIAAAVEFAAASDGDVRLVHVVHAIESALAYLPDEFFDTQKEQARTALEALAGQIALPDGRVSVANPVGDVHREVLAAAEAFAADLIVIGSHRPSMSAYLLGSNAAWIVRHATCSVLVIR